MAFQFCSFASGSSGNCYLVRSESTTILIDVGITGKRILEGLAQQNLSPEQVDGILVTHEHVDHVKSLKMLSKKAENAKDINFAIIHKPAIIKFDKHVANDIIPAKLNANADGDILKYRKYGLVDYYKNKAAGFYVSHKTA